MDGGSNGANIMVADWGCHPRGPNQANGSIGVTDNADVPTESERVGSNKLIIASRGVAGGLRYHDRGFRSALRRASAAASPAATIAEAGSDQNSTALEAMFHQVADAASATESPASAHAPTASA
jgi:hypothetical protein